MKNRIVVFSILALLLSLCSVSSVAAFETRGSAFVPCMSASYSNSSVLVRSYIYLTNITGSDVTCRVTFRDHAGDDVTSYSSVYSGNASGNSAVTIATVNGTFTLPAGETRYLRLSISDTSRLIIGQATIEWASDDPNLRKAIIAYGKRHGVHNDRGTLASIPINNGQPF
ncbi:hypothetical protein [Pseudodesulfovibrio senegalensis]|uniref:Calx-beta domain-containing protein n=1 Tax=Pseudodesulfovibrio senegalensis TaxID=1721087 RepID=A0A6N6N0B2_9BACT|nr:hypothetical protein [Pseudodesulfovibrio senegalensis]KAB1440355.1 hypothetical protein F8A88_13995 [Pseudodesulfovibrio senegalensis]